ncbi:hypothetical protein KGQ20_29420 [Catenulispora sp. NF23]|uniref:Uncharacterized protein n=1 Tax=Catenulispora pinistramenti TaxID=2705254 RepID=A0ABS5KRJ8_9ACTN|nr:hypothetical protein [Catenulispora pinistramenti]MBS2536891.1 hypothetical protein [Catenulispora pinistramenti]MBS2548661.1 hypothetical protein [Catenulispora pinistramenti]
MPAVMPGRLSLTFGDLVQVKKSNRIAKPTARAQTWPIKARQLADFARDVDGQRR